MNLDAHNSTREIDTLEGPKPYAELVPLLALGVERVMKQIVKRPPVELKFTYGSILSLHEDAFRSVVHWAGHIRKTNVQVGYHTPPEHYLVRELLRNFADDLEYRVSHLDLDDLDPDEVVRIFAFCEGRFTYIHPFIDFNGRVARLLSWMLVVRLGLPHTMEIVPPEGDLEARRALFEALHAYDLNDRGPLEAIWERRLTATIEAQLGGGGH